jgi:hypothetical protein
VAREESFPRNLSPLEQDLLLWLLPADRPGYREYRALVESWRVAARGRRGEGNYILAPGTVAIDVESPLPQVFAYGVVETAGGRISIALRERLDDQLEFEIMNLDGPAVPAVVSERRRWTLSTWLPRQPCPMCGGLLREVGMKTQKGRMFVLALCGKDERIWVHDEASRVNHLIPLTNFYNELMLHANVRDPAVALSARRLFTDLGNYSDAVLSMAFASYNKLKTKIHFEEQLQIAGGLRPSFFQRLRSRLLTPH